MGALSGWHLLLLALVVLLMFGGSGKISSIMGDFAKGIKSFKKGMQDDEDTAKKPDAAPAPPKPIESAAKPAATEGTKTG